MSQLNEEGAKCQVCAKHRHQLRTRKSKLSGRNMFVCNDCFDKKFEPRWLIILTAQSEINTPQVEAEVRKVIINKQYVGETIPAADLYK